MAETRPLSAQNNFLDNFMVYHTTFQVNLKSLNSLVSFKYYFKFEKKMKKKSLDTIITRELGQLFGQKISDHWRLIIDNLIH